MLMKSVLVLNPKGGCGKTTIATSLAAYFAGCQERTVLLDFDAQSSSSQWLEARQPVRPRIGLVEAHGLAPGDIASWRSLLPEDCQRVIIDTPAALKLPEFAALIEQCDAIVVPVIPSEIDLRAASSLISALLRMPCLQGQQRKLAVVANRAKQHSLAFRRFQRFAERVNVTVAGTLRDSQNYVYAGEKGLGIHDLPRSRARLDLEHWEELLAWLSGTAVASARRARQRGEAAEPAEAASAPAGDTPAPRESPPVSDEAGQQARQQKAGTQPHALVVDDSGLVRKVTERFLLRNGFRVSQAADGQEGLAALAADRPDVVILDAMMPGMDGFAFCEAVRGDPALGNLPIIMVTALEGEAARERAMQVGADDFLIKPYREAQLLASIRKLLPEAQSRVTA